VVPRRIFVISRIRNAERFWKTSAELVQCSGKIHRCRIVKPILSARGPRSVFDSESGGDQFELPNAWESCDRVLAGNSPQTSRWEQKAKFADSQVPVNALLGPGLLPAATGLRVALTHSLGCLQQETNK